MKKIILSLLAFACLNLCSLGAYNAVSKVSTIGKNLITKNSLPSKTTFKVVDGEADNSNTSTDFIINISKDELKYAGNDNETAAVVSHKMGQIVLGTIAKNKLTSIVKPDNTNPSMASDFISNKISLEEDKEADIVGVDFMIKAGYNPLAMIVILTKMPASTLEAISGKPANSDRAMNIFDYLTFSYPDKIKAGYSCQEYRAFLEYANPIVQARNSNKKKLEKFNKEQAKAKDKRLKKIRQYKTTGGVSGWDATYDILQGLTGTNN